jgi:3-dehydroquinate synthase
LRLIEAKYKSGETDIFIGEDFAKMFARFQNERTIIITDKKVYSLYKDVFPQVPIISINQGEKNKTLETVDFILKNLVKFKADKKSLLVGIGGGIVCDITGFVASSYMRGTDFALIPTTLLSQVDASIGGKNAVNYKNIKNLIGFIKHPGLIFCDPNFVNSLPKKQIANGFAEIIKIAVISSPELFEYLEEYYKDANNLNPACLENIIFKTIELKINIVKQDETDKGIRRLLNLGHTVGHGLEAVYGLPHGYGVSIGIISAMRISESLGLCDRQTLTRVSRLINNFNLPVKMHFDLDLIFNYIGFDKKKNLGSLHYVIPKEIGSCIIKEFDFETLKELINASQQPRLNFV